MHHPPQTQPQFNVIKAHQFYKPISKFLAEVADDYVGHTNDIRRHHGPLVHLKALGGLMNMAFITHPDVNRELFVRHTDALGKAQSQIQTFLFAAGPSVATAHGDDWRVKRKEANALFARQMVEAPCQGQVGAVETYVTPGTYDGETLAKQLAARTSSRGILGRDISQAEADIQIAFSNAARDRFNAESGHIVARPNWMLAPWRRDLAQIKAQVIPIVQASIDALRGSDEPNDGLMNHYVNGTFVTSNDAEMRTIMLGLLMGAQDNIAAGLSWVLALLACHPALQDQIAAEVAGKGDDAASLQSCPLLCATVAEVLRLRPPAQANQPRILRKGVDIAGHRLPKGTFVLNSIYAMHHDPAYFPDPDRFDPTRFLDGALARSPGYAPFGHGPRNCVAQGMALQQLRATIVGILRHHRIEGCKDGLPDMHQTPFLVPAPFGVTLKPA